jgi:hypothetical protein
VFGALETIPPIENFGSTASRLQFGAVAVAQEDEVNITNARNGLIRIPIIIPANPTPGFYELVVDPTALSLAGKGPPIVATPGPPGGFFIPEPASVGLLGLGGLLALRRRRLAVPETAGIS